MAATVSLTYAATITTVETLDLDAASSANSKITRDQYNTGFTRDASTTPAVSVVAAVVATMSGGALTIDLTSLTETSFSAKSFDGLKLVALKFINPSANSNPITIEPGATNGYDFMASGSVVLKPGQEMLFSLGTGAPSCSSSAKNIDISGTGTEYLDCLFVGG